MKKFVCQVCGYVYEGETAPEKCPQCGVPGSKFTEVKDGEMKLAAEHEYGIYGKTVKNNADISAEGEFQRRMFRGWYVPVHGAYRTSRGLS